MIKLELNQSRLRGGQKLPRPVLEKVLRAVSRELGVKKTVHFSGAFVSGPEIRKLNRDYRGKDKATDVLAFPFPGEEDVQGEVLINYARAKQQAKQMKHSVRQEVIFLLVHGILHLFGYDHIKPKDAAKMLPLQEKILVKLGVDPRL